MSHKLCLIAGHFSMCVVFFSFVGVSHQHALGCWLNFTRWKWVKQAKPTEIGFFSYKMVCQCVCVCVAFWKNSRSFIGCAYKMYYIIQFRGSTAIIWSWIWYISFTQAFEMNRTFRLAIFIFANKKTLTETEMRCNWNFSETTKTPEPNNANNFFLSVSGFGFVYRHQPIYFGIWI